MLQGALNTVEEVCVRGENYGVVNLMEKLYKAAARTREEQAGGITTDTISPWYGAHLIDTENLLTGLRETLISNVLQPPAGTQTLGFKEIRHTPEYFESLDALLAYALFLTRLLPGVKFVVNTRNAEDTSKSGWWKENPEAYALLEEAREWMLALPERLRAEIGNDRVVVMEYDEWNQNPHELARMLGDLGYTPDIEKLTEVSQRRLDHLKNK